MRVTLAALVLVAAVGCSDSSTGPRTITGTYPLLNINGDALPALIDQSTNYTLEVTEGTISLGSNGTFTDSYTLRENDAGTIRTVTIPCSGNWTRSGNDVQLEETASSSCGDYATGTWDGSNTLTVTWDSFGLPAVHRR
jgi:hypothetical protein